jgi:hypothetical protein
MSIIDDYLVDRLQANKDLVSQDYFSMLHLVIMIFKATSDVRTRYSLKQSVATLLENIAEIDISQYKQIGTNKEKRDEFERII